MEALETEMRSVRRRFKNQEKELNRFLSLLPVDLEAVDALFSVFHELQDEMQDCSKKLLEQMKSDKKTEEELNSEHDQIDSYKYRFRLIDTKVKNLRESRDATTKSITSGSVSGDQKRNYKLPTVEIRKFDGTRTEWLGFWAQFQRIHEDPELDNSDKFWYLIDSLKSGSEARELASMYPQSADNYPKVVEALKKKFGNEDMLLQVYIRELLSLVISNVSAKDKLPFQSLFMKVDSHLQALKTLKLKEADPEVWLYPLVESSLPERVLYNWQHSPLSRMDGRACDPPKSRLDLLMEFMEREVEIHQNIQFAKHFSHETAKSNAKSGEKKANIERDALLKKPATVTSFHARDKPGCFFCEKTNHSSQNCFYAKRLSYEDLKTRLLEHRACFRCFDSQHKSFECKTDVKCDHCGNRHNSLICRSWRNESGKSGADNGRNGGIRSGSIAHHDSSFNERNRSQSSGRNVGGKDFKKDRRENSDEPPQKKQKTRENEPSRSHVASNLVHSAVVYSQTLMVKLSAGGKSRNVRVFLDTGSKRSYIRKEIVENCGLIPFAKEKIVHSLFGGIETEPTEHGKYNVRVESLLNDYKCNLTVRDKDIICYPLERVPVSIEMTKILEKHRIELTDIGKGSPPIDLLIGSDFYGKIVAEGIRNLENGLVAINTKLGWTVIGEERKNRTRKGVSLCLSVHDKELPHLWDLECLGIRDPVEVTKGKKLEEVIQKRFIKNVERKEDGRYLVSLPWKDDHPYLPSNKEVAFKRLESTTRKLIQNNLYPAYEQLFLDWLKEGFIEKVGDELAGEMIHYLPHRAVIKDSLTTPVRPVFDASCKTGKNPSLNDCLHKGCNYILSIPEILLRFRENEIGFTSDIRKAFQMIEVKKIDQDCFRFLWWKSDLMEEVEVYRHVRVPFGATCSPFILGAVLKLHLSNVDEEDKCVAQDLLKNFYVDNCVSSVSNLKEYETFQTTAVRILKEAQMDLRMWLSNSDSTFPPETRSISVLGLLWDREEDQLYIDSSKLRKPEKFTKRTTLSLLQKIFDPVGFTCPVTVLMKTVLQKAWKNKLKWDEPFPENEMNIALGWCNELASLGQIRIPRLMKVVGAEKDKWSIHVFTDASKEAYATAIFLRSEADEEVNVQLLGAKSRITPPKKITIPRLELLGCLIGAILYSNISDGLDIATVPVHFWCDSTTALAWIKRNDKWGTFVGNRVKKILTFSRGEDWRYVPTALNAADLPSRGCSPKELLERKWWEGPTWLRKPEEEWPSSEEKANEEEIQVESLPATVQVSIALENEQKTDLSFTSWIRIIGWMNRFIRNCRMKHANKRTKPLPVAEIVKTETLSDKEKEEAEITLIKTIQNEGLDSNTLKKSNIFEVIKDENGVLRIKTRIVQREDLNSFKFPAILPGKHPLVRRLILDLHKENAHCGVGILLSILREKYWILKGRRNVQNVLIKCQRCRRFTAKPVITDTASLPLNRVKDAEPFEVTGVDLAGPLLLKNGKKTWVVIFTCALYRAVHLRLIDALTTKAFIKALHEFVIQFRRPAVIYSDNGTNFKGTDNLFATFDWKDIEKEEDLKRIQWIFNPSTAAWWGGFWERLIRSMKDLIRRTLGRASVTKFELEVLLRTVEKSLNSRPLTYISENPEDLEPLTPNLFLHPFGVVEFPELEMSEADKLRFRYKYVQTLKTHLKTRWRNEYLGLLVGRKQKSTRRLQVGELVVVSTDNKKRVEWPLARIVELIPSKADGICRVAKIRTESGILTRPVQRLHPLEADLQDDETNIWKEKVTRSGRVVKPPTRYE